MAGLALGTKILYSALTFRLYEQVPNIEGKVGRVADCGWENWPDPESSVMPVTI